MSKVHVNLQAELSTPSWLFKPVFAWPQHHGNAVTQLISAKFHLTLMLASHFALIVIFNLFSLLNTKLFHTI